MRKRSLIAILVLVLWLFSSAAWAAPGDEPILVPDIPAWEKDAVYPGANVEIEVTYTNKGTAPVPDDAVVKFRIEIREISLVPDQAPVVLRQSDEVDVAQARGKKGDETFSVRATVKAPAEGSYILVAILTVNGAAVEHAELFGVESALPAGVAQVFAGLGIFAALMAVMAAGTEVLIDSFKVFVGMKEKVTALEALDLLKKELPGQLAGLGVAAGSQAKIDQLFTQIDAAQDWLDQTLQPLATAGDVYRNVQSGQFSAAFAGIKTLETDVRHLQAEIGNTPDPATKKALEDQLASKIEAMKSTAQAGVTQLLARLERTFKLGPKAVAQLQQALSGMIATIDLTSILASADYTVAWVGGIFQEIQKNGADWTANWLRDQARTYVETGGSQVMLLVDGNVLPLLTDLGFSVDAVQSVRGRIAAQVDRLELVLDEKALTYTQAVRNLLQAVEERRNDMQSPVRKLWRWLRDTDQVSVGGIAIGIVLVVAILVAACLVQWPASWPLGWVRLGVAGACLAAFMACIKAGAGRAPTFGQQVAAVERTVNGILGREQDVDLLGQVAADVKDEIEGIIPTNVAAVILKRENKHEDEETSRLRLLRVISVFVGGTLAYMLNVDGLVALQEALPAAGTLNGVLLHGYGGALEGWRSAFAHDLTTGIVLTGLAAAAGSKFWRDVLGRLEATKEQAESTAMLLRRVKSTLGVEDQK